MLGQRRAEQPIGDVQHVHLRERLVIRLGPVRVLVGAEPQGLNGRHPELAGAADVLEQPVADEERLLGRRIERRQRPFEDLRVRLALSDLRRKDRKVDPFRDPHLLEIATQQPAGVERVRDQPELETARPKRLEHGVRRRSEHTCRLPCLVLAPRESGRAPRPRPRRRSARASRGSRPDTRSPRASRAPRTAARTARGSAQEPPAPGARSSRPRASRPAWNASAMSSSSNRNSISVSPQSKRTARSIAIT